MLKAIKSKLKFKTEYFIALLAFVLIVTVLFFSFDKDDEATTDTQKYVAQTESKLKKSIEKIDGVKNATVTVTVSEGIRTVIAEDTKEVEENGKTTKTSTPVLISGKPIVLGEIYPEIAGVVIICNCSDAMTVRMSVLDVVTTMLDLPCDKVRILTQ